jgi:hypothetical protein
MRLLPVIDAFAHALRSTSNNFGFAWHVSWPWMAVLLPVLLAGNIFIFMKTGGDPERMGTGEFIVVLITTLLNALAFASIAVNWHRYVLLDEVPKGAERLRLDNTVWRYFGNTILIFLILFVVGLVIGAVLGFLAAFLGLFGQFVFIVGIVALALFSISAFYRFGIKLPGVALYRRDFGLADAWRSTTGNSWRILGLALLYFLTAIAVGLALWLVLLVIGKIGGTAALALLVAIQMVVSWVMTILGVTLLTSLYGFFVESRDF